MRCSSNTRDVHATQEMFMQHKRCSCKIFCMRCSSIIRDDASQNILYERDDASQNILHEEIEMQHKIFCMRDVHVTQEMMHAKYFV